VVALTGFVNFVTFWAVLTYLIPGPITGTISTLLSITFSTTGLIGIKDIIYLLYEKEYI
jgi:hypothetical protein